MVIIKQYILIITIIIVMVFILIKGCLNPFSYPEEKSPEIEYIIKSDTVWTKDTLIVFKSIIKPKWDTIYKIDTIKEGISLDDLFFVRIYNDSLIDTNLTIYSTINTLGILNKIDISYRLKTKPYLITNNIIKTITEIKIIPNKFCIITGIEMGGNQSSFNISPYLCVNFKRSSISYRYGAINNTHSIGVGYKIFNSKK